MEPKHILLRKFISLLSPIRVLRGIKHVATHIPYYSRKLLAFMTFFVILCIFFIERVYGLLEMIPLLGKVFTKVKPATLPLSRTADKIIERLEKHRPYQVRQSYLVALAFSNLKIRRNRTVITVLGMATGVGIIVYLLSLGYGIERMVIGQIATLQELNIVDVAASQNTTLRMNKETIKKIGKLDSVDKVVPLVSLVGRVSYNKAQTDVLAYAVDDHYLKISQIKLKKGSLFTEAGNAQQLLGERYVSGIVAGADTKLESGTMFGKKHEGLHSFQVLPDQIVPVWQSCSITGSMLGYTVRTESPLLGQRSWGTTYAPHVPYGRSGYDKRSGEYLGSWVTAKYPLFTYDVNGTLIPKLSGLGKQLWEFGCIQESMVQYEKKQLFARVKDTKVSDVLGTASDTEQKTASVLAASASAALDEALARQGVEATGSAEPVFLTDIVSTDSAGIEYVRLVATQEAAIKKDKSALKFAKKPYAQAIISTGLMKLLGIEEKEVLEKTISVSFIVSDVLVPGVTGRQYSDEVKYKIVGLTEDDEAQYFYVPFYDMFHLGIQNFSQLKVVMKNESVLTKLRLEIENMGFNATSVADTVAQIERLFANVRLALAGIGMIALAVASLGMFNTLTVSLLERTREIGGMKVIGMVSEEIQDLFLAEAMIMGFSGGIGGLLFGYVLGQLTSVGLSVFSLAQGLGYLQLTTIPFTFIVSILVLSFIVGVITGLYPAKRAQEISALNALRYE